MSIEDDANRALGIELQIEELVERRERASAQHRRADFTELSAQINTLYDELASVAEHACRSWT
jgi:hypothetical protein